MEIPDQLSCIDDEAVWRSPLRQRA